MKWKNYLKDKLFYLVLYFINCILVWMILVAFKVPSEAIWVIIILLVITMLEIICVDFFKKQKFYNDFTRNLNQLDKKYFILETLKKPSFYEGEILFDSLYEINKSMMEYVKDYKLQLDDFKEYIEMWIHEIKVPLATLVLMNHNHHEKNKKILEQLKRLEDYLEQVLYYVRCDVAEKDYLIQKNNLSKIINQVLLRNKDDFLELEIDIEVSNVNLIALTDSKWLEFILNQIINNSVKYIDDKKDKKIKIEGKDFANRIELTIWDNGIGIPSIDIPRVFDKSFTGENGRKRAKSTGMGLYICKKLCHKLGHQIYLNSKEKEFTSVTIVFSKNEFYQVLELSE